MTISTNGSSGSKQDSWGPIKWAFAQEIPTGPKFVLVALARYAKPDGTCFPGRKSLAADCGMHVKTVDEHRKWLEDQGYIERVARYLDKDGKIHEEPVPGARRTSNGYRLNLGRGTTVIYGRGYYRDLRETRTTTKELPQEQNFGAKGVVEESKDQGAKMDSPLPGISLETKDSPLGNNKRVTFTHEHTGRLECEHCGGYFKPNPHQVKAARANGGDGKFKYCSSCYDAEKAWNDACNAARQYGTYQPPEVAARVKATTEAYQRRYALREGQR